MGATPLKAGHSNTIFTVRDIVDDTGDLIRSMEFQEHGQLINSSGTGTFSPKTYQGALSVNDDTADSGLWLMGFRHFDSSLGRFISRDPIGFAGGLNLFGMIGTNPLGMVDPSGLHPVFLPPPKGLPVPFPVIHIDNVKGPLNQENSNLYNALTAGGLTGKRSPYKGMEVLSPPTKDFNCHGFTMWEKGLLRDAKGKELKAPIWVPDMPISELWASGLIEQVGDQSDLSCVRAGDFVLYNDHLDVTNQHSGVISSVGPYQSVDVTSKWGDGGLYTHGIRQAPPYSIPRNDSSGVYTFTVYRTK
jgi:RHS repeat-associated protein